MATGEDVSVSNVGVSEKDQLQRAEQGLEAQEYRPPFGAPPPYQQDLPSHQLYGPPPGPVTTQGYPISDTVVITQPAAVTVIHAYGVFGRHPISLTCPGCQANVTTSITYHVGGLAWLLFSMLCIFGCWLGCCLIPFLVDDCKDVIHSCPNCHRVIGRFNRI